jgi:DNA-binding response OmpR family regulator
LDSGKLLLVGSNHEAWQELAELVRSLGYQVDSVDNCQTAYQKIQTESDIDIVVVDADSAEECGARLAGHMRADSRLSNVPVIVAGTQLSQDTVQQMLALRVNDIVLLPIDPNTLRAKIDRTLRDGRPSVLIVDDEDGIRQILTEMLELERFRVYAAASAEKGLEAFKCHGCDVVVSDIVLPGINGVELMKRIKASDSTIPVVLITGHSGQHSPQAAIESGADGYFAKPFNRVELVFTLNQLLQKYSGRSTREDDTVDTECSGEVVPEASAES